MTFVLAAAGLNVYARARSQNGAALVAIPPRNYNGGPAERAEMNDHNRNDRNRNDEIANDQNVRASVASLLAAPPRVVNVGLELFANDLAGEGAKVVHVQWAPPAGGNSYLAGLLDKLRS